MDRDASVCSPQRLAGPGDAAGRLTARWQLAPRARPATCPDLEALMMTWVELLGDAACPTGWQPAAQGEHPGASPSLCSRRSAEQWEVACELDLVLEQHLPSGAWEVAMSPRAGCLHLVAHLAEGGKLAARHMHPLIYTLEVCDDRYVPAWPSLEPGRRNARRLGDLLGRSEMRLELEMLGIEAPRFPRQACSWGFLDPHDLGRPC